MREKPKVQNVQLSWDWPRFSASRFMALLPWTEQAEAFEVGVGCHPQMWGAQIIHSHTVTELFLNVGLCIFPVLFGFAPNIFLLLITHFEIFIIKF